MAVRQTIRSSAFGRHCHEDGYAAIVLSGAYEEAGDEGRYKVGPGDVLLHGRFEGHVNRFGGSGAVVLNVALPEGYLPPFRSGTISDADFLARLAERTPMQAAAWLLSDFLPRVAADSDWPDELARKLISDPAVCLTEWSEERGLRPWAVSRGFMQVFAISPSAFRARSRARHAWKAIATGRQPLAEIAAKLNFADQAHMTRSVKELTGKTPGAWRCCK